MIFRALNSFTYPPFSRKWLKADRGFQCQQKAENNSFADSHLQGNATIPLQAPDNITENTHLATQKLREC
jgi:hypothetical protein